MGAASSTQKYTDTMPANARKSAILTHFYGKQKPSSKDGKDTGLQEVYKCWDFPKSTGNVIYVLPKWRETVPFMSVEENWDPRNFDPSYPAKLDGTGIQPEQYQQIIRPLNQILQTYFPFQQPSEVQARAPSCFSSSSVVEPVPVVPCGEKSYIVEMRKRLQKASDDFPKTQWSLHVHKYCVDLAGDLFIETIYHSLQIKLIDPNAAQDSNSVSTLSPSHGLKLEDVSSKDEASNYPTGKEDGAAAAPSPRPNYGDADSKQM